MVPFLTDNFDGGGAEDHDDDDSGEDHGDEDDHDDEEGGDGRQCWSDFEAREEMPQPLPTK